MILKNFAKITTAEQLRSQTMLVNGGRDMEAGAVSVCLYHGGRKALSRRGK